MSTATTRRAALRSGVGVVAAGLATPAVAKTVTTANPDAALIAACHQFAEDQLRMWYRYVISSEGGDIAATWDDNLAAVLRITATPATTPEGWRAKALAFSAWDRDAYDDIDYERHTGTTLLATLLREMVAPARNAIVARCTAEYGPLPAGYTLAGIWIGLPAEEQAAIDAENATRIAAREAQQAAAMAEVERRATISTMTREELEASLPGLLELRDLADIQHKRTLARIAELAA